MLRRFDFLQARDSLSAGEMAAASGRFVPWFADMSVVEPVPEASEARHGIIIGDSVRSSVSTRLAKVSVDLRARGLDTKLTPVITREEHERNTGRGFREVRKALARARLRLATRGRHHHDFAISLEDYLERLSSSELSVTGRFHSVCLSMASGTPFVALSPNSRKIEAMLGDAGLGLGRLVPVRSLTPDLIAHGSWAFRVDELEKIETYLADAKAGSAKLFDEIANHLRSRRSPAI